jgi:hypothetical protein
MGVVVGAVNEALAQRVAIKLLRPTALSDREALGRFVREARAAASLRSEHVARVLDTGTLDDGRPFIAMEHRTPRADARAHYVTMYDYDNATTSGGVVRRVPRTSGVLPCDYGGSGNKRPFGLHVDASRIYWTNQGEGRLPYTNGSVVSCDSRAAAPRRRSSGPAMAPVR